MKRREFIKNASVSLAIGGITSTAACAGQPRNGFRLSSRDASLLNGSINGQVIRPADLRYDNVRSIWNAWIDHRPSLIVRPVSTGDVSKIVKFAQQQGVSLSVKGGGHNHNGYAVSDGGVMMDLSLLNRGTVIPEEGKAIAASGMTWGQFDAMTHQAGRATTGAIVSMVGLAGYTLGGGIGWLHRKFGAGCDNLTGVELVLPSGDCVWADHRENEDLFWALRGGGGNFGVATKLHYRIHQLSTVLAGLMIFPLEKMETLGAFLDEYLHDAPDDLNIWMLHRLAPSAPFLPKDVHGKPVLMLAITWTGDHEIGERMIAPIRGLSVPIADTVRARPYPQWQSALDGAWGDGFCNEWVGGYLDAYDENTRHTIAHFVNNASSPFSDFKVALLGGAYGRKHPSETAFGYRQAKYAYVIQTRWRKDQLAAPHLSWTYEFQNALQEKSAHGVYVNFIGKQEPDSRVKDAYEESTFARLARIKFQTDPKNFFHLNANIRPDRG